MLEFMIATGLTNSQANIIPNGMMAPVSGSVLPSASATLAPNGDACLQWAANSCAKIDMTSYLQDKSFTLGFYIYPTSYQDAYGTTASRGVVMQIGPFGKNAFFYYAKPVKSSYEADLTERAMVNAPVNVWAHVALSFDPNTRKYVGFLNGVPYPGANVINLPPNFISYFGGLGDRSNALGGAQTRYGYRGLMSTFRIYNTFTNTAFDPLTF